jgi:F-type H+-transporting ATPase subunit b
MSSSTSWARHRRLILCTLGLALLSGGGNFLRAQAPPQGAASAGENTTPVNTVPEKKQELRDEDDEYRHSPAVQKLGALIGLDPEQAATSFTVFNFLILLAGIAWLLLKTLPKAFRNRNSGIQKHLVDARTATEESAARLSSVEERLSKLDEQIAAMRGQAEADSARDEQRIHASVEEEKAKILAAAEAEIQAATAMARREIQAYAADLAIDQAARKLVVSAETDRLLVESFAHRLLAGKGSEN